MKQHHQHDRPERVRVRVQFSETHGLDPRVTCAVAYEENERGVVARITRPDGSDIRINALHLAAEFRVVRTVRPGAECVDDVVHAPEPAPFFPWADWRLACS